MSIVLDSSGWIELLSDEGRGHLFEPALSAARLLVPSLVRYEVGRYALTHGGPMFQDLAIRALTRFQSVILDSELADAAAIIAHQHKLATADAIIYATARQHAAELWTQDAHFKDLPGVRYFAKT
jgi:predicted nucleic acid-binding protein